MVRTTGISTPASFTGVVFEKGPRAGALLWAEMISLLPAAMAPSGLWGVVQPQEAIAVSMITGELLILVKAKSWVAGTFCLIFPKSKDSCLNLMTSSAFLAWF